MMHCFELRVYYEDTDLAGIVYYANYLKFIERARSEYLREGGIDQAKLRAQGLVFSVVELSCQYFRPARYDDMLRVETGFDEIKRASFRLLQSIWREQVKIFEARVRIGAMTLDARAQRVPKDIFASFDLPSDMK